MEAIAEAPAPLSLEELIDKCGASIQRVMNSEDSDESNADRIWILRKIHKNYLYYRDLQYFAPTMFNGVVDITGAGGPVSQTVGDSYYGEYDYTQNLYRGYCRKLEAVLGLRMPNCVSRPTNAEDPESERAARAGLNAVEYINWKCDMQLQVLYLIFSLFNFGTSFWYTRFEVDGEKYGYRMEPDPTATTEQEVSPAGWRCPECGQISQDQSQPCQCGSPLTSAQYVAAQKATVPDPSAVKQVENGSIEISLHDASEVSVPLTCTDVKASPWLRWQREWHASKCLKRWGDKARRAAKVSGTSTGTSVASLYGVAIRSAMASPIGLSRPKLVNHWTVTDDWWTPQMYEMVDDQEARQILKNQFPSGLRVTYLYGTIMEMREEKLTEHWTECKPEPAKRIMADPLGDDWVQATDISNNLLNQRNETVERSNDPGFADPRRLDFDAWQRRRDLPTELFPVETPPGKSLADVIFRPEPVHFSEQIAPFRAEVENTAKNISGELDSVWGGGGDITPTARQQELMTNAALRQLGVTWKLCGKSLEQVYLMTSKLLGKFQQAALSLAKKDQFGTYTNLDIITQDLSSDLYYFEAEESIPLTWGQQRDLLMWMLDKPAELLEKWGFNDPLNIDEFKSLLGMPGYHTPQVDERDRAMTIISRLLTEAPQQGPDGSQQPSVAVDWEDDNGFYALLVRAYLNANPGLKESRPDGYQNLVLWGQAQEKAANQPAPTPPPKASVSMSLKGEDLGSPAVQAALQKTGVIPDGVQVTSIRDMPPPGAQAPPTAPDMLTPTQ